MIAEVNVQAEAFFTLVALEVSNQTSGQAGKQPNFLMDLKVQQGSSLSCGAPSVVPFPLCFSSSRLSEIARARGTEGRDSSGIKKKLMSNQG